MVENFYRKNAAPIRDPRDPNAVVAPAGCQTCDSSSVVVVRCGRVSIQIHRTQRKGGRAGRRLHGHPDEVHAVCVIYVTIPIVIGAGLTIRFEGVGRNQ